MKNKKIIVVGGGFGGFNVTQKLLAKGFEVALINDHERFVFTPLLAEVASSSLSAQDVSFKFTDYFKQKNFTFVLGHVTSVDFQKNQVYVGETSYHYDYLVLAAGARRRPLDIPGVEYAFPLKNLSQAVKIKSALISKVKAKPSTLNVNVIGAGATGVEFIFAVHQLIITINKNAKPVLNLFDPAPELMMGWSTRVKKYVAKKLDERHINFYPNSRITAITEQAVKLGKQIFPSDFTILTVGVVPNTHMVNQHCLDSHGCVDVSETLQIKNHENVFAVGDLAAIGDVLPQKLAKIASVQGKLAARNIIALEAGRKLKPYNFKVKVRLFSLGVGVSMAEVSSILVKGQLGNLTRVLSYIYQMPGLRQKWHLVISWMSHTLLATNLKK